MSLETWKKEFYPKSAGSRMGKKAAIEHSIKKWEGLLPENLEKHAIKLHDGNYKISDDEYNSMKVSGSTCALCQKYDIDDSCGKCPLYEKIGFECGNGDLDEDGWELFIKTQNPELMLNNLRSLLVDDEE